MLKAKITSDEYDAIDEGLKAHYAEKDGDYILAVEAVGGIALEDIAGLKGALSKANTRARELDKTIEKYADLDPDKAREAMQKLDEMANWSPDEKVKEQIEAVKKQLVEKYKGEINKRESRVSQLQGALENAIIKAQAIAALSKHKGNAKVLLPHVIEQMKLVEEDGKFYSRVIDENGNIQLSMQSNSQDPMTAEELVALMKEDPDFAGTFEGPGASGTGARASDRAGTGGPAYRLTEEEMKNPAAYRRAKEAAEKAGKPLELPKV